MLLLLLACTDPGPALPPPPRRSLDTESTDTAGTTSTATGTSEPIDCTGAPTAVSLNATDMPTVFDVRWLTATDTPGRVSYDNGAGRTRATAWDEGGTNHVARLVGLRPGAPFQFQVDIEDLPGCGPTGEGVAGELDVELPALSPTVLEDGRADRWTVLPVSNATGAWITLVDEDGAYVWSVSLGGEVGLTDTVFRATLSRDGTAILAMQQAGELDDLASIYRFGLDGDLESVVQIVGAHTDFVEMPDGSFATLGWEERDYLQDASGETEEVELDDEAEEPDDEVGVESTSASTTTTRRILGDTLLLVGSSGEVRTLWNVFDWFDPDLSQIWNMNYHPADPGLEDWSHVNGMSYQESSGDFAVSMTFNNGAARIDGATGEQEWVVGDDGDFATEHALLAKPHSAQLLGDDQVVVFNRSAIEGFACSNAVEITLDRAAATADATWAWQPPSCYFTSFLGQAWRLDNGNTFVNGSSAGELDEVTPEGEIVWGLTAPTGTIFGFAGQMAAQ